MILKWIYFGNSAQILFIKCLYDFRVIQAIFEEFLCLSLENVWHTSSNQNNEFV
jgi:hypothetical protein